ncbi:hypothetical protein GCM10022199_09420 [Marihabitans asiaticum]|uniref:Glycosyl transferase family 2 n=1 Tax=Marihabitans asiaticum TaxID=415218 RepID=A0A560WH22_9MICO|nr:glycosyltransferase family 2 protein [Marihabitans asiaticum]TWD16969.1 glycosyl transferase family 2 [Marihabitans asiaticum]
MAEVSIIVTTYNIEDYVEQSLASVAAQTLSDIEVLVVDDGSSDSTPQKIADFCAGDPRFVPVLLEENSPGGVATAANAGLDRATGTWVGFVDGDDYVEPTMFEKLHSAALTHGADLAMCEYQEEVDGTGERRAPADAHRWAQLSDPHYVLDVPTTHTFLRFIAVPWRKLYRRELLERESIRFPVSDGFFEDNPFHWFALVSADSIAVVPEVLCYHRVARAGQTMATADERLFHIFHHHDTIHTWLASRGLLDLYQIPLLGWVISQMEWISRRTPPELRRRLFDILVPIFGEYSEQTIARALQENNKGAATHRLAKAVAKREFGSFARCLSTRPGSDNPLVTAAFHLRHSGVRHTASLTRRYARNAIAGGQVASYANRIRSRRSDAGGRDVMFGLVVIEKRLARMEQQLDSVERRLASFEGGRDGDRPA